MREGGEEGRAGGGKEREANEAAAGQPPHPSNTRGGRER
jgi:hypothetical protein